MSTHLPEYLVAAFVKRLSRLCLVGPANALLMVLPFIGNLLLRHKGLAGMISKTCSEADDPFDFAEPDPAKCKAVDSGLWEIRSLQSHVLPQVSQSGNEIYIPLQAEKNNCALIFATCYYVELVFSN
jgi:U3 small nucleolar RNA-associated protein 19